MVEIRKTQLVVERIAVEFGKPLLKPITRVAGLAVVKKPVRRPLRGGSHAHV